MMKKIMYKKQFCKKCERVTTHKLTLLYSDNSIDKYFVVCLVNTCKRESNIIQYKITHFMKK